MAVTIDASTPAGVVASAAQNVTTAAFSPPGGTVLAACIASGFSGPSGLHYTMTDTSGGALTWTARTTTPAPTGLHNAWGCVFTATVPAAGLTGITVKATEAGSGLANGITLQVYVLDGAAEPNGASVSHDTSTASTDTTTMVPVFTSSLVVWATFILGGTTAPAAAANNTMESSSTVSSNAYGSGYYSGTITGGVTITIGSSTPATGDSAFLAGYEIPPAPPAVTFYQGPPSRAVTQFFSAGPQGAGHSR